MEHTCVGMYDLTCEACQELRDRIWEEAEGYMIWVETKRCPNCKYIERLVRQDLENVQCTDCKVSNIWACWIGIADTDAEKEFLQKGNRKERFICVYQAKPTIFATDTRTIVPLHWEVIDRGPKFEVWKEETVEEMVIARFDDEWCARRLCDLLRGTT